MNKKYQVLLFDMDGTLADTDEMIISSFNDLYDKYRNGNREPKEKIYYFSGPPIRKTLKEEFPELDQEKLYQEFHDISYGYYKSCVTGYPFEKEVLMRLKKQGFKMAIVTNKFHPLAEYVLEILDLKNIFEFIIGSNDVKTLKPSPEGINKALENFNLSNKKEALYIGDNEVDYLTACNAEIDSCLCYWGPRKLNPDLKPTYKINSYLDIEEIVYEK